MTTVNKGRGSPEENLLVYVHEGLKTKLRAVTVIYKRKGTEPCHLQSGETSLQDLVDNEEDAVK